MLLSYLAAGAVLSMNAMPRDAQALSTPHAPVAAASLFRTPSLPDGDLAEIYGTGTMYLNWRQSARDDFENFSRVTAQMMPVTFENWFNDVATPLIVDNLIR